MARTKNFDDNDVIEKATYLFWKNGYGNTSMSALEKTMGINKFSIYASFGNKQGVFLRSLACYKQKLLPIVNKLKNSEQGLQAIRTYFYDSLAIYSRSTPSDEQLASKGCLMTNTRAELKEEKDAIILKEIQDFIDYQSHLFKEKLLIEGLSDVQASKKANYLIIAKQALSAASKVHSKQQLDDFIDVTLSAL